MEVSEGGLQNIHEKTRENIQKPRGQSRVGEALTKCKHFVVLISAEDIGQGRHHAIFHGAGGDEKAGFPKSLLGIHRWHQSMSWGYTNSSNIRNQSTFDGVGRKNVKDIPP